MRIQWIYRGTLFSDKPKWCLLFCQCFRLVPWCLGHVSVHFLALTPKHRRRRNSMNLLRDGSQVFPSLRCSGVASRALWPLGSLRPLMSSRRVWWRRHRPWLSAMPCDPLPPQGLRGFLPGPGQEVPGGSVWAPCFSEPTRGWDPAFNKNWRND